MTILNDIADSADCPTVIEREGSAWVELIVSGNATRADLSALAQWRAQSKDHDQAFATAVKVHKLVGLHQKTEKDSFVPTFLERVSTRRSAMMGLAAIGFGSYAAVRPPFDLWPSYAELASDYRTTAGERRNIAVVPGISVQMNTRSSVSLPSGSANPKIVLVDGEIAVSTQKMYSGPLTVQMGSNRVLAGMGGFDVRYDASGTCVTCLTGQIEIEGADGRFSLVSRQQVRTAEGGFTRPKVVDLHVVTAWQRGLLIFHDASLATVVTEINRYRPGRVVIANASLAQNRFSGEFSISRLEDALRQIEMVAKASAVQLPGGIVVLS